MTFSQQLGCEVVELNVQIDHVHLLIKVPPKLSISDLIGVLKGRTAIRLFNVFPQMRKKPYWGNPVGRSNSPTFGHFKIPHPDERLAAR
jgi:putative transposase